MKVAPALLTITAALDIPVEVTVAEYEAPFAERRRVRSTTTTMNMMVVMTVLDEFEQDPYLAAPQQVQPRFAFTQGHDVQRPLVHLQ